MSLWRNVIGETRAAASFAGAGVPMAWLSAATFKARRSRRLWAVARAAGFVCDSLEPRRLLATVTWVTNGNGDWSVGSNWSTGSPPALNDTVVIDVPGNNNVIVT